MEVEIGWKNWVDFLNSSNLLINNINLFHFYLLDFDFYCFILKILCISLSKTKIINSKCFNIKKIINIVKLI
jgi:hypothetical protein